MSELWASTAWRRADARSGCAERPPVPVTGQDYHEPRHHEAVRHSETDPSTKRSLRKGPCSDLRLSAIRDLHKMGAKHSLHRVHLVDFRGRVEDESVKWANHLSRLESPEVTALFAAGARGVLLRRVGEGELARFELCLHLCRNGVLVLILKEDVRRNRRARIGVEQLGDIVKEVHHRRRGRLDTFSLEHVVPRPRGRECRWAAPQRAKPLRGSQR
mmetsp:Transcript_10442/g.27114  ORF Transcript_10442/g.27114 Transcript_10442/m.27114 type:complete len:216 (-) Transcript_10442:56-703(-)